MIKMFKRKYDKKLVENLKSMNDVQKNYVEVITQLTTQLNNIEEHYEKKLEKELSTLSGKLDLLEKKNKEYQIKLKKLSDNYD